MDEFMPKKETSSNNFNLDFALERMPTYDGLSDSHLNHFFMKREN